jgi:hypothetical protein
MLNNEKIVYFLVRLNLYSKLTELAEKKLAEARNRTLKSCSVAPRHSKTASSTAVLEKKLATQSANQQFSFPV